MRGLRALAGLARPGQLRRLAPAGRAVLGALKAVRPLGWIAIGGGLVCLALGAALGWAEARYLGAGLLVLAAFASLFLIGRSPFGVELHLTRARVRRGERAQGRIELRNTGSRASLPVTLELPVGQGTASFGVPRLARGGEWEELFQIPAKRRSVIGVGPVRSVRGDALGMFRREVRWTGLTELFVHPDTVALGSGATGVLKDLEGRPTQELSNSDVAFHALREYVPGDDVRHISWKALAKTGTLMVRQFEETRRSHIVTMLSMRTADFGPDEEEFELAVSACASVCLQAVREERDLTVITGSKRMRSRTGMQVLDELSRVQIAPGESRVRDLTAQAAAAAPGASMAMLVTGSMVRPSAIHDASMRLPVDARRFAIRCELGAKRSLRAVGETTVITIGQLDQLPGALFAAGA